MHLPHIASEGDMDRKLGRAILAARRAARLTQHELGERVGVHAHTVRRWEWEEASPTRANRTALIAAIYALNAATSGELAQAFGAQELEVATEARVASTGGATPVAAESHALQAADATLLKMADDVDAAPRRIRSGVLELLKRMRASNLSIEALEQQLERQLAGGPAD
jgi:transcriptional regulator with XRE-family HTH domain